METHFSAGQLENPRMQEANAILRTCIHCGFCTATCPTYVLLGDERDSPRGRIYLTKHMFENNEPATPDVRRHIDRCLSCYSCMTTCPSGVDYLHLVDMARVHIEETSVRPLKDRIVRRLLRAILPYPNRFRVALIGAAMARPFRKVLRAVGPKELAAMLDLAPSVPSKRSRYPASGVVRAATRTPRARVALLSGCAQRVLRPEINDATIRLLTSQGVEVVLPEGEVCCGALVLHMGREEEAKGQARRNIDAWWKVKEQGQLDAIIINASGCGTTVKDYGHLFARDPAYAEKAKAISHLTKDITEFLVQLGLTSPAGWSDIKVAYHSACSMQHGQRVLQPPRKLLRGAGFTVVEIPEGHLCCGSAGTYNILQSEIAVRLRDRKLQNIARMRPDCVAAGNIGCITQLSGSPIPIVHTVELLDWAYGGPCPEEIRHLSGRFKTLKAEFQGALPAQDGAAA